VYPMNPDLEFARSRMADRMRRAEQARFIAEAGRQPLSTHVREQRQGPEPIAAVEASCGEVAVGTVCGTAHADVAA
jgi:hypothetical protein